MNKIRFLHIFGVGPGAEANFAYIYIYSKLEHFVVSQWRPRRPQKWCQQVLLRASLNTRRGARMTVVTQPTTKSIRIQTHTDANTDVETHT